jgi:Family of unknown function (DUF6290)
MTDDRTNDINPDELDWEAAEVHEGRQPGAVISVRLGSGEAARVRQYAASSGITVSQVIRQALTEYVSTPRESVERKVFVAAFTYGGAMPVVHEKGWQWTGLEQTLLPSGGLAHSTVVAPTTTEPTRVVERVIVDV